MDLKQRTTGKGNRASRVDARLALAEELLRARRYEQAREAFQNVISSRPADVRALAGKSLTLTRLGRFGEALSTAEQIFLHEVNSPRAYQARAVCYQAMGFPIKAREAFEKAVSYGPDVARVHYDFARFWATRQEPDKCRSHLERAFNLEPELAASAPSDSDLKPYRTRKWFLELISPE